MAWSKWLTRSGGQFLRLSGQERWLLLQALALLPLLSLALRVLGFPSVRSVVARLTAAPPGPSADPSQDAMVARAASKMVRVAAGHGLYRATCLPRSLA